MIGLIESGGVPLVVDLGGGMRLLVLEALLASLSLPQGYRDHVRLIVYLEGRNEYVELSHRELLKVLARKHQKELEDLTYVDREILKVLRERGETALKELHEELSKAGIELSKQNLHRRLSKLVKKGL